MNVTEAINECHSIRAFLPKPVEKDKPDAVLAASVRAPSWANTQLWEIFVVTGSTLERIKEGYRQKYADKAVAARRNDPLFRVRFLAWNATKK
jgi:nitroreductase